MLPWLWCWVADRGVNSGAAALRRATGAEEAEEEEDPEAVDSGMSSCAMGDEGKPRRVSSGLLSGGFGETKRKREDATQAVSI